MHSRRRNAPSRTRAHALNERAHVRSAGERRHEPACRLAHFSVAYEPTASKACSQRCARACAPGSLRKRVHSWVAQDHTLAARSRVCGAWQSLCGRTTRRRATWQHRTLARPSAACDAFMPVAARARRSHRRAHGKLLGGASPAARPAAGRRGCTCGCVGAARACAATRALRERRRSYSSARTASAAPARQESSQSPVCTSACMRE
jgi:hypothetical protein